MALHVDIVQNQPLEGITSTLASVQLESGALVFLDESPEHSHSSYWRSVLVKAVDVDPDQHPREFLAALSERFDGTYVFATEPHEEGECPYHEERANGGR